MQKKTSNWVTIREEFSQPETFRPDKVENKLFWGVSFLLLVIFTAALIVPTQFLALLKGDLFGTGNGGGFQLIPPYEQQDSAPDVNEFESEEAENTSSTNSSTVVQPQASATEVQVEPVSVQPVQNTVPEPVEVAEPVEVPEPVQNESAPVEIAPVTPQQDANLSLLEKLSQQLETLKAEGQLTDEEAAILNQIVANESQAQGDLHGAAEEVIAQEENALPSSVDTTVQLGQPQTPPVTVQEASGYRLNPYRVTLDPRQLLQQNLASGHYAQSVAQQQAQQQQAQAAAYAAQQATYSQQQAAYNYNAQLAGAQGTPGAGPADSLLIAFALTFMVLLFWKGIRLLRA